MLKTKMTIPVRILGVIGIIVLFASLYLPWATINGKELLDAHGKYSAMDLVQDQNSKYLSYFFMGVYIIMILGLIALLYCIFGRPTTGLGVTMFITAGTYLILIIIMSSFFQSMMPGSIQLPGLEGMDLEDTDGDGLLDKIEIEMKEQFGTDFNNPDSDGDGLTDGEELEPNPYYSNPGEKDSDGDGDDDFKEYHEKTDPWPEFNQLNQENGDSNGNGSGEDDNLNSMFDTVSTINDKMAMLTNTTVKAENGVYITTGTCVYIVIIGILLKIDRKKRKNLAIELKYHKKDLGAYKMAIEQALLDGYISDDEMGMLDVQRKTMGITADEHYTVVTSMADERKASEEAVGMLLSILDENFRYRGEGIFGKKRPRPRGRRGPPPRGRPRRRRPPRDYAEEPSDDDYGDYDEPPESSSDGSFDAGNKGDEWDF